MLYFCITKRSMRKVSIYISTILLLFVGVNCSNAQFNIKIGYNIGYLPSPSLNQLVDDFNEDLTSNSIDLFELSQFDFITGIEIGGRYTFGNTSLELSFDNLNRSNEVVAELNDGRVLDDQYTYVQRGINLAFENRYGRFGWGSGISYRTHNIRGNIATTDAETDIILNRNFAIKTFLVINLGGTQNIGLQLRPFFIYPLGETDLNLLTSVNEWNISPSGSTLDRFQTFGISFSFYNGPQ